MAALAGLVFATLWQSSCRAAQRTARCLCDRTCLRSRRARTSTPIRRPRRHSRSEAEILRHLGRLHRLQADLARARAPPISPGLPCLDDRVRGPPRGARYTPPAGGGNSQSPAGALLGAQSGRSSLNHEIAPRRSAEPESPGAPHGQSAGKGDHFLTFSSRARRRAKWLGATTSTGPTFQQSMERAIPSP